MDTETDMYRLFLKNNVVITEMKDNENLSNLTNKGDSTAQDFYYISEPFDYIFEPEHYPKPSKTSTEKESSRFKHARMVREIDGVLEYEYRSYTYKKNLYSSSENLDELDLFYENHLDAQIRGVSLSKWPNVGFGFSLAMEQIGHDNLVYVCEVLGDSPAECCLQLGDILIELDDMNFSESVSIESLNKYLEDKDNVHLMVIHQSKYARLKAENEDLLKNTFTNCEDIVICNYMHRDLA